MRRTAKAARRLAVILGVLSLLGAHIARGSEEACKDDEEVYERDKDDDPELTLAAEIFEAVNRRKADAHNHQHRDKTVSACPAEELPHEGDAEQKSGIRESADAWSVLRSSGRREAGWC